MAAGAEADRGNTLEMSRQASLENAIAQEADGADAYWGAFDAFPTAGPGFDHRGLTHIAAAAGGGHDAVRLEGTRSLLKKRSRCHRSATKAETSAGCFVADALVRCLGKT